MATPLTIEFIEDVVRFETLLWSHTEKALAAAAGPTLSTLTSLRVFQALGGKGRVQDLSRTAALTVGAASKVVDRLERDGFVTRRPHPDDRRSSLIALTNQGEAAVTAGNGIVAKALSTWLDQQGAKRALAALAPLHTDLIAASEASK